MKHKNYFITSLLLVAASILLSSVSIAQPTNKINYQAVARNAGGSIMANTGMSIRISILASSGGTVLYSETHPVTTNQFGLFTLQIGGGTPVSGNYNSLSWGVGTKWIQVEMDLGAGYVNMGESQLLSVPYAIYAANGGSTYTPGTGIDITSNVVSLTNVGSAGTYGSSTLVPVITTDAQGRVTNVTTAAISSGGSYTAGNGIDITSNVISTVWTKSANNIFNNNTANVGIGTASPAYLLHVNGSVGSSTAVGVVSNGDPAGLGLAGQNTAPAGAGLGIGFFGATQQSGGFGVYGANLNASGTGIIGLGNNTASYTLPIGGAGGAFYGNLTGTYGFSAANTGFGVYGKATNAASAYGVIGNANNVANMAPAPGVGGGFSGFDYGVSGYQTNQLAGTQTAAGYFAEPSSFTLVEAWTAGSTHYKIIQSVVGAVSTCVADMNGNPVTLHAPETPEFYFQDYGQGTLVNGTAHINIDPILAKNVTISEKHPLRVFVQLEGDCKGVFVTNKTASGFDVVELNGGTSNVSFQWSITCNVADAQIGNRVSKFADLRFEAGPVNEVKQVRDDASGAQTKVVSPMKEK